MTPGEIELVAASLAEHLGHDLEACDRSRVLTAIEDRCTRTKRPLMEYLRGLDASEVRALANELVVGETYFFRGADHWAAVRDTFVPELLATNAATRRISVLSIGCATGEEPYTAAMVLADCLPLGWTADITGLDVNPVFLERARRGRYSDWSLRAVTSDVRERWFTSAGKQHDLVPRIRDAVTFLEANLVGSTGILAPDRYDIVLFRNVLIYFTPEAAKRAVARIAAALRPHGVLLLGHSETLREISTELEVCTTDDTFYYRLGEARPAAPPEDAGGAGWYTATQASVARIAQLASPPALDPAAALRRVAAQLENGEVEAALASARALLANDASSADAHYVIALCREHGGAFDDAITAASTAIVLDGTFALPHLMLGRLARQRGDHEAARRWLRAARTRFDAETAARLAMFGGGFTRELFAQLCDSEIAAVAS